MLRITINETPEAATIILEGRLAGAWVAELKQAWTDAAVRLNARRVSLDLRNVTFVNEDGKRVLREIEEQTGAELIATTPWTKHLVAEICDANPNE
jgi:anti-anti-sigma regulatory factor